MKQRQVLRRKGLMLIIAGLDLSTDNTASGVADDIGRGIKQERVGSPHEMIQKELFNEQQATEYSQAYKKNMLVSSLKMPVRAAMQLNSARS